MKRIIFVGVIALIGCIESGCEKEYKVQRTSQPIDKNKVEVKAVTKDSVYDSLNMNSEILDMNVKEVDQQVKLLKEASKPLK